MCPPAGVHEKNPPVPPWSGFNHAKHRAASVHIYHLYIDIYGSKMSQYAGIPPGTFLEHMGLRGMNRHEGAIRILL